MRYSTEPKFRKYVKGYGFLSFAGNFAGKWILQQKQEEMLQKLLLKE